MYSVAELIILGRAYLEARPTVPITRLSADAAGHAKFFGRLFGGHDCTARSAEAASKWFDINWPDDLAWPAEVRPRGSALAHIRPPQVCTAIHSLQQAVG
jgi:hypothetical protein